MSPTTNSFFNHTYPGQTSEQSLVDDLVIEQIAMFGLDVIYMPRKMLNLDDLLHEASKSVFELGMSIPMYLKSFTGYQNGMEILSKFGVRSSDEITMVMSRSQFTSYYSPLIQGYHNSVAGRPNDAELDHLRGETAHRPKEGDLIYFPFDGGIFEIKYVMFDEPFFQLGTGYVFEIQCEKFEFSGETFDTGYEEIDTQQANTEYYRMEFDVEEGGSETFIFNEKVRIYDLSGVNPGTLVNERGDYILTEKYEFLGVDPGSPVFRLYKDPGFVHEVDNVTATVMTWDLPNGKLVVGDINNMDPDQMSKDTGEIDYSKFDTVIIVGQESGAHWISKTATTKDAAFNDEETIQDEFNAIKILDLGDENPFGFV